MLEFLSQLCSHQNEFIIHLNNFDNLDYCCRLSPDTFSRKKIKKLFKTFLSGKILSITTKDKKEILKKFLPHISIGRDLTEEQLSIAKPLFSNEKIDHSFLCDSLAVRILNEDTKQFEVIHVIPFGNPSLKFPYA